MPAPFHVAHTTHSDRPGDSQTLDTASGHSVFGMSNGYGDFFVEITPIDSGRLQARINWATRSSFAAEWEMRRPRFPDDVHEAVCHLFPFVRVCDHCGEMATVVDHGVHVGGYRHVTDESDLVAQFCETDDGLVRVTVDGNRSWPYAQGRI